VLWAIGIGIESGAMLAEDRDAMRRPRRDRDLAALAPADPAAALDPHHFAERFGLFLIILLGEVVVEAGQASVDGDVATTAVWTALVAAMILAASLCGSTSTPRRRSTSGSSSSRADRRRWRARSSPSATCCRRSRC
jgi:hypothetical protein